MPMMETMDVTQRNVKKIVQMCTCAAGSGASDGDKVWVGEINGMTGIPWPDRLHNNSISDKLCSIWVWF